MGFRLPVQCFDEAEMAQYRMSGEYFCVRYTPYGLTKTVE
jgi:hypothetical protein